MTDFTERFEMYLEAEMNTQEDIEDAKNIIALFKEKYGVELCEENADTFIAHILAAYGRLTTGEEIEELPEEVVAELTALPSYDFSKEVLKEVMQVTSHPLNNTEQGYALLHINNLISLLGESGEWKLD